MGSTTKGWHWYTNGKVQVVAKSCPEGFRLGKFKWSSEDKVKLSVAHTKNHLHWYNNGIKQVQAKECPDGYIKGRLPITEETRQHLSESHKGNHGFWTGKVGIRYHTAETKHKISEAGKKRVFSKESKDKISKAISSAEVQEKRNKTLQKNNTFNTSSQEEYFYKELLRLFSKEDVIRQYKDLARYPFNCDFYIKSLDLFIELNINWTHGKHLFNKDNNQDIETLNIWKDRAQQKQSKFYKQAIKVWTVSDVKKYNWAKINNLNYLVAYNTTEMLDILNRLANKEDFEQ